MTNSDWRDRAGCLGMSAELFFPSDVTGPAIQQADRAKMVCAACPVSGECLDWALATRQHDGIWGGLGEDKRRTLRRTRRRGQQGTG